MSGRAGGGLTRRRRSARLARAAGVKPYDPAVLQRHFPDDPMHLAIKRRDFDYVQEILDSGDKFCSREGLNCYKLAGDDPTNVFADSGLHGALSEMHRAIVRRNFELVQQLLDNGDTLCTADGTNCFILAASASEELWGVKARWEMVEKMLRIHSRGILARDDDGLTLLAYFWTNLDIVKQIIELGVDLNAVNKAGQTLCVSLFWAPLQNTLEDVYNVNAHLPQLWKIMMSHEEFQQQVVEYNFFRFFVSLMKKSQFCQVMLFDILELNLINIDLNFVEEFGKDILIQLFCADLSHSKHRQQDAHWKLWNRLLKLKEFRNQVKEIDLEVPLSRLGQSDLALQMLIDIERLSLINVDQLTIKMKMHPFFYIMGTNNWDSSYLSLIEFLLAEHSKNNIKSILKQHTILISKNINDKNVTKKTWLKLKEKLNIPDNVTFDIISYFLYSLPKHNMNLENSGRDLTYYLTLFLEKGFVPVGKPGVVHLHPIHALLYNMVQQLDCRHGSRFRAFINRAYDHLQPSLLLQAILLLKDYPIPHRQVLDSETGHQILDVQLLLSSLMTHSSMFKVQEMGTPLLDCMKAFMPLSPVHPLQHFFTFYKIQSRYCRLNFDVVATYCQFLQYTFEVCGKHKFQAVDQNIIDCVNLFFENLEKVEPEVKEKLKNCDLMLINSSTKAESEVGSLRWLSILQIRKTLFLNRSSTTTYLPSLIRTLIAEGCLPKGLEADLLVYEPDQKLNF